MIDLAKDNLKRLNVYLNEDFFRFVSDYADKTGLSKSAVCVLALKDLRDREIMMPMLPELLKKAEGLDKLQADIDKLKMSVEQQNQ